MADALAIVANTSESVLEDVEEQNRYGANRPARRGGWGISPNLTHAKVAREKPLQQPAKLKPEPVAPIAKAPSPIGRFLRDYGEIVDLCRLQAEKLQISRHETDRLAGLPEGHSGHVLSTRYSKLIGPTYLVPLLEHFGLRLLVVEDPALVAKTLARRTVRQSSHVRRAPQLVPLDPGKPNPPA